MAVHLEQKSYSLWARENLIRKKTTHCKVQLISSSSQLRKPEESLRCNITFLFSIPRNNLNLVPNKKTSSRSLRQIIYKSVLMRRLDSLESNGMAANLQLFNIQRNIKFSNKWLLKCHKINGLAAENVDCCYNYVPVHT